jgi:hypothetical protein
MIALGSKSLADARRRPVQVIDDTFYKSEWMESGEDPVLSPTVYLAEQPPHCELLTHFHRQNQFQLFVEGTGSLGPDAIGPVTVHYAGAYTGYGPLLAGAEWLKYFTIRAVFDTGFTPVSEAREKMVRGPKRHCQVGLGEPWSVERLQALEHMQQVVAIAPARGLAALHLRLPPGARFALEPINGSVGQFVFVLAGTAQLQGTELARWESGFVSANENHAAVAAGEDGVEIVALHMPITEPEYAA